MGKFAKITVGCDPELFLMNPNDGGFVSAHEYVKGTKDEPFVVDKGAVQLDGMAAEFNIDPVDNVQDWVENIGRVWGQLSDQTRGSGYVLRAVPVADFDPLYLDNHVPTSCKILGCNPDFNAWTMRVNDTPDQAKPFRTGSGHIHVGWGTGFDPMDPDHFVTGAMVARQLDYYLGLPSLEWDSDNRRRDLYGKAGAFRPKPYGMEYRVLSNAWLQSEMLQRWVFTATVAAMKAFDEGRSYFDLYGDFARHAIDGNYVNWRDQTGAPTFNDVPIPPGVKKKAA